MFSQLISDRVVSINDKRKMELRQKDSNEMTNQFNNSSNSKLQQIKEDSYYLLKNKVTMDSRWVHKYLNQSKQMMHLIHRLT